MIPLEDLPETQVGFGFGLAKASPIKKPAYLKVPQSHLEARTLLVDHYDRYDRYDHYDRSCCNTLSSNDHHDTLTMTTNFWRTIMTTFYLQNIKLITSKNKHRFVAPAGVKQLTKAQWEAFSNQAS